MSPLRGDRSVLRTLGTHAFTYEEDQKVKGIERRDRMVVCSACGRRLGGERGPMVCADSGGYVGRDEGPRIFCTTCAREWLTVSRPIRRMRRERARGITRP
ncbi:MAG: hypothetical protein PVSMB8_00790 [Vulcanimicrobiaceae bacterium]